MSEQKVDIGIIAEPYNNLNQPSWQMNLHGKTGVWSCDYHQVEETQSSSEDGFVWVKVKRIYVNSCWAPPSYTQGV